VGWDVLGASVGEPVGAIVGWGLVGVFVGVNVGAAVGEAVVGASVGADEGAIVGGSASVRVTPSITVDVSRLAQEMRLMS
jgi:hypothetical protein